MRPSSSVASVEPEKSWVVDRARLRSKSANTPFLGREVKGAIALTMSEGAVIFDTTEEA